MLPLLLVFGSVFLPTAFALKCYECLPGVSGSCTDMAKECPAKNYQCAAVRVLTYHGASEESDINMKMCALAAECAEGSINFGVTRTVLSTKCCTSELCNTQPAPEPKKNIPNGKKCYRCDGQTCTGTLNCEGNENHCVSTTVDVGGKKMTMKGCASQLMCSSSGSAQITGAIGAELSCCQGNYCNSASAAGTGLLILVVPFISLVLFS